jgi:hypothetical protein
MYTITKNRVLAVLASALILLQCSTKETTTSSTHESPRLYPIKENSKWGYIDSEGKVVIKPAFDYAWDFSNGVGRFRQAGKYGFVNAAGEIVIQPTLTFADNFSGEYTRINTKDTVITDLWFEGYGLYSDWSYINKQGVIFDQRFTVAEPVKGGFAQVKDVPAYDQPYSYVSFDNGVLNRSERITEAIFSFNGHTLAPASDPTTGKIGMVDLNEQWVIFPSFDQIEPMSEGLAAAKKDNIFGYIDAKGTWVYQQVVNSDNYYYLGNDFKQFSNGLAAVRFTADSYGFINKQGKPAFTQRFKSVSSFNAEGLAIVSTETGTALINTKGELVVKPHLDIQSAERGIVIYRGTQGFGAKDLETQKQIIEPTHTSVSLVGSLLKVTESGATSGFINKTGEFVIAPQFNEAWEFKNGKAVVNLKDRMVYVDTKGKVIGDVPENERPYYDQSVGSTYALSDETGKFGFRKNGVDDYVIPASFDFATDFENNVARINIGAALNEEYYEYQGGKWGLIDQKGEQIVPPSFEMIMPFQNGVALVNAGGEASYSLCEEHCEESVYYGCNGGVWGLIDQSGKTIVEPKYAQLVPFGKNFIAKDGGSYQLISPAGEPLSTTPLQFSFAEENSIVRKYDAKHLKASENGKTGLIDQNGKWIVPAQYDDIQFDSEIAETPFTENFVLVKTGDQWGALHSNGTVVVPVAFQQIRSFSNGMAAVLKDNQWGFVNANGELAIEPQFMSVRDFQGDVAIVTKDEGSGELVIDQTGKIIFEGSLTTKLGYEGFVNGLCIIRGGENNKAAGEPDASCGVINSKGKVLFPKSSLSDARVQEGGLLYVIKNGKWAVASTDGSLLTGYNFDWIESYNGQELIKCNVGGEISYGEFGYEEGAYGGLFGMINKNGKVIIPIKFAEIGTFQGGLAPAKSGEDLDQVGYFDLTGKQVRALTK